MDNASTNEIDQRLLSLLFFPRDESERISEYHAHIWRSLGTSYCAAAVQGQAKIKNSKPENRILAK